jgi:hypothetical protein
MHNDIAEINKAPLVVSQDAFATLDRLLKLAIDPKACAARLAQLKAQVADIAAAEARLADARAAVAEYERKTRAEIEAEKSLWLKRRAELDNREAALNERTKIISDLEDKWRYLGEPDSVRTGFQDAEFTPLQKAQRAHSGLPIRSLDPDFAASLPRGSTLARDAGA